MEGTSLALHIGHRISIDFDFFSQEEIPKGLFPKVKKVFSGSRLELLVSARRLQGLCRSLLFVARKACRGRLFLEQLIYLDDIEEAKIIFLRDKMMKSEVSSSLLEEVKKIKL